MRSKIYADGAVATATLRVGYDGRVAAFRRPDQTRAAYETAWRKLRRLKLLFGGGSAIFVIAWIAVAIFRLWVVFPVGFAGVIVAFVVQFFLISFPCPRCGFRFATFRIQSFQMNTCANCQLIVHEIPDELGRGASR